METRLNRPVYIRMSEGEVNRIDRAARREKISRAEYIRRAMRKAVRTAREATMEETLFAACESFEKTTGSIARIEKACMAAGELSDQDRLRLERLLDNAQASFSEAKAAALEFMAPDAWRRR